jgi:tetratricopeptide (TPR) repeat protein
MSASTESGPHGRARALVVRGQADQDALAAHLTPADRAERGELHDWSPKDHIAHNNFWRQDANRRMRAAIEGGSPPNTDDDLAWNDRVFVEQRATAWERLVAETERLRAEAIALIANLSADDLTERGRFAWQGGGSLAGLIFVNWYDHPAEHWADVYISRNRVDEALELRQAVADATLELFPDNPTMYSYMVYKLGGYSARTGRSERAISAIREALTLNPDIAASARHDPDLDPLRALPGFQALNLG